MLDRAIVRVLPAVPRSVVRRVAAPYIAGPTLDDARRVVSGLNAAGMRATVDVLGEEIAEPHEADQGREQQGDPARLVRLPGSEEDAPTDQDTGHGDARDEQALLVFSASIGPRKPGSRPSR